MRSRSGKAPVPWILLLLLLSVSAVVVLAYQASQCYSTLSRDKAQRQVLLGTHEELQQRLKTLQEERDTLESSRQSMILDRENLITQVTALRDGKEKTLEWAKRVGEERDALQQALERSAQENAQFREALEPLERRYAELRDTYENLVKERQQLQRRLADAEGSFEDRQATREERDEFSTAPPAGSKEQQLKEALSKETQAHKKDVAALRSAQMRSKELESRQAKAQAELAKSQGRFNSLEDNYTKLLAQNTAMKQQVKRFPQDVTKLAHQHERLVKENADVHYNLGVLLSKSKQYEQAATEFRKVIELRPDDAEAYYNLGVIYAEHLPDREKAMAHFRRYLQLKPGATDAGWVQQYIASWQAWEAKDRLE